MKSTAESPVKLPFKSDFTVKFECNSRYLRSFETKAATPKGPFRVRFPAGVPNKKEPTGSFLFGFRCGSEPVVRPIAQQWHERRATFGKPHAPICAKYSRRPPLLKKPTGSFLFGFRCGSGPVVRPIAQEWHERRATFGKPHAPICAKYSRRPPLLKKPTGSFLFGFRCGSGPVVRPIAQEWHEERSDEVFPAATSFKKSLRALFCLAFGAEANPRFVPLRSNGTKS